MGSLLLFLNKSWQICSLLQYLTALMEKVFVLLIALLMHFATRLINHTGLSRIIPPNGLKIRGIFIATLVRQKFLLLHYLHNCKIHLATLLPVMEPAELCDYGWNDQMAAAQCSTFRNQGAPKGRVNVYVHVWTRLETLERRVAGLPLLVASGPAS